MSYKPRPWYALTLTEWLLVLGIVATLIGLARQHGMVNW